MSAEGLRIICAPVSLMPDPTPYLNATKERCCECGQDVWLSEVMLTRVIVEGVRPFCMQCWLPEHIAAGSTILPAPELARVGLAEQANAFAFACAVDLALRQRKSQ